MPISSQVPIIGYVANGVTKSFAFPFAILSADDLKVKVGADVVTMGFSIAGVGDRDGGSVTFTDAPASPTPIILYREVTLDRTTDYQENGDLLAIVLDDDLDRIWMALQDQLLLADRALRTPIGETLQQLPTASERALMALAFDAAGNPIVVRGTNDGGAALALDLLDTAPGKGAALVGFIQDGAGTVGRSIMDELRETVRITQYGAVCNGVVDDTPAVQKAVTYLALGGGGRVKFPNGKKIKILGTVLVPSNIAIDLNGCELIGSGAGGNNIFETGYVSGGAIVTNIGTAPETRRVIDSHIFNGKIANCGRAFNLYNFNEGCLLDDIEFENTTYAVYSARPFYSAYTRLTSRGAAGGATNAAFLFSAFVNVISVRQCFSVGRELGFSFSGGCYGLTVEENSVEQCVNGMLFQGVVHSTSVSGNYFESITGKALEFSGAGAVFVGVDVDRNWFNLVETAISATNFTGRWGRGNRRNSGNCTVDFGPSTNNAVVEIPRNYTASNITAPGLPAGYSVSVRSIVSGDDTTFNSGSGLPTSRSRNFGGTLVPLTMHGNVGAPDSNVVPFCTHASSNPGGTPFSVVLDTNITTQTFGMVAFNIRVSDNSGPFQMAGVVFGTTVFKLDATAKTVVASDNGGKLRLTLGSGNQFSHPSGSYSCTGTVRII